jgi:Retrotransposon gag protein
MIMLYPLEPKTVGQFIQYLEVLYGDPNEQATAQQKLNQMSQETQSFPAYFVKFQRYARESGWNHAAQINRLIESLNPELQRTLVSETLPEKLEDCANLVNRNYNNLLRLNVKFSSPLSARTPTCPPKPMKDPNAMDLDPHNSGYAPKNSAERQKRIKEGRCFKCGSKDHLSPKCTVSIPRHDVKENKLSESESEISETPKGSPQG